MKKITVWAILCFIIGQVEAVAQLEETDPRPEIKALDQFDGNWSFTGITEQGDEVSGVVSFYWVLDGRFQRSDVAILDDDGKPVWMMCEYRGWDGEDGVLKAWHCASHGGIGIVTLQKSGNVWRGETEGVDPDGESIKSTSTMKFPDPDTLIFEETGAVRSGMQGKAKYTLKRAKGKPAKLEIPVTEPFAELKGMDYFTGKWTANDVFTEEGKVKEKTTSTMNCEWILLGRAQFQEASMNKDGKMLPTIHAVTYWNPAEQHIGVKTFWSTGVHEWCIHEKKAGNTWELPFKSIEQDGKIVEGKGVFKIKDDKTYHYDSDWIQDGKACHWHSEATRQ